MHQKTKEVYRGPDNAILWTAAETFPYRQTFRQTAQLKDVLMGNENSLRPLVVRALLLMVGFYLLVSLIVLICFLVPLGLLVIGLGIGAFLLVPMGAIGGLILRGVLASPYRNSTLGIEATKTDQPELWATITAISEETNVPAPDMVYIDLLPNASLHVRGGFFGFGGKSILSLGLPFLALMSMGELRGLVGHELGHCAGGNLPLGRWVFSTLDRALMTEMYLKARGTWVSGFFTDFLEYYLAATQSLSQYQEFEADRIAVSVAGAHQVTSLLRRSPSIAAGWSAFWSDEIDPALEASYFLPITAGYATFYRHAENAGLLDEPTEHYIDHEEKSDYSSHPVLKERLQRINLLGSTVHTLNTAPALDILSNVPQLERELVQRIVGDRKVNNFRSLTFDQTRDLVTVPRLQKLAKTWPELLQNLTPATLPAGTEEFDRLAESTRRPMELDQYRHMLGRITFDILAAALSLRLLQEGWEMRRTLGEPVKMEHGAEVIMPRTVIYDLVNESNYRDEWLTLCQKLGIGDLALADCISYSPPTASVRGDQVCGPQ